MKIIDVTCYELRLPEVNNKADGTQDLLLVKVDTDIGISGYGEVDSSPSVAKAIIEAPLSHATCCGLKQIVLGQDPFAYEKIWDNMYQGSIYMGRRSAVIQAMSGIDLALWDIMGKFLNVPVYKLLGGCFKEVIPCYSSALFGRTPEETSKKAERYLKRGFKSMKFGWESIGTSPEHDENLIKAIRETVGDTVDIMVDAGFAYDTKTAIKMAKIFSKYNIYWLEEPLHPDNVSGYQLLRQSVDVRIAAGEEESSRESYRQLMDLGCVDLVQIDVTRVGGLTSARKIAWDAHARNLPVANHSFTTDLNIAASLHLLASIPNAKILEYCVEDSVLRNELTKNKILPDENGLVEVPTKPGLGVEFNDSIISKYSVKRGGN